MREEMENIASEPLQLIPTKLNESSITKPQTISSDRRISNETTTPIATNAFQDDLQRQVLDLKQKNRSLQIQIDDFVSKQKLPDNISDNTIINNHIKSLNETISKIFFCLFEANFKTKNSKKSYPRIKLMSKIRVI